MDPREKIHEGNPWYTTSHLEAADSPAQRRIVAARVQFILKALEEYRRARPGAHPVRVLDAGCGDGVLLDRLASIPDIDLFAVDYNPLRVQRARSRAPRATVAEGDLTALQFPDESFDVILLNHVLEHVPEDSLAIKELARVLRPEGWLLLGVPNEGCLLARLRNKVFQPSIRRTTDHVHFYTEPTIRSLVTRAKLHVRSVGREGFFTPYLPLHSWLAARDWGFRLLVWSGKIWPSQAAGLRLLCTKRAA